MGDLIVTCSSCGEETTVSEYVDPEMATCRSCGEKLKMPKASVKGPRKKQEKGKKKKRRRTITEPEDNVASVFKTVSARADRRKKKRKRILVWTPSKMTLIIIFVLGAGILSFIRYAGVSSGLASEDGVTKFRFIGVCALAVVYVAVVVDAFSDSVMHGILSLFVMPFYGLWYLFTACDSFVLRLIVAILVIPFGMDLLFTMGKVMMGVLKLAGKNWN